MRARVLGLLKLGARTRALALLLLATLALGTGHALGQAADPHAAARERWNQLSEGQRERLRESYREFGRLPKSEQLRIVQRYQHFRSRQSSERQALRDQYRDFRRLPGAQRQAIRQSFERYRKLSGAQRQRLRAQLRELSHMSSVDRQLFLAKLERWRELSPEQRQKVRTRLRQRVREGRTHTR